MLPSALVRVGSVLPTSARSTQTSAQEVQPTQEEVANRQLWCQLPREQQASFRMLLLSNVAQVFQRYAKQKRRRKYDSGNKRSQNSNGTFTSSSRGLYPTVEPTSGPPQSRELATAVCVSRTSACTWDGLLAPSKRLMEIKDVTPRALFTVIVSKPCRPRSQTDKWAFCFLWKHRAWLVPTRIGTGS